MANWLSSVWLKVAFAGAFVILLIGAVLKLIGVGRKAERADRAKVDQVVRNRVDAARPPESGETAKSLQDGKF